MLKLFIGVVPLEYKNRKKMILNQSFIYLKSFTYIKIGRTKNTYNGNKTSWQDAISNSWWRITNNSWQREDAQELFSCIISLRSNLVARFRNEEGGRAAADNQLKTRAKFIRRQGWPVNLRIRSARSRSKPRRSRRPCALNRP